MGMMHYTTTINHLSNAEGNPVVVTAQTAFANGAIETFSTSVDPNTFHQISETSKIVGEQIKANLVARNMANHENIGENAEKAVLLALLKLPQQGINPLLYVQGQPAHQLLINSASTHAEMDLRHLAQQVENDLLTHYYSTKAQNNIPEVGAQQPSARAL